MLITRLLRSLTAKRFLRITCLALLISGGLVASTFATRHTTSSWCYATPPGGGGGGDEYTTETLTWTDEDEATYLASQVEIFDDAYTDNTQPGN